MHALDVSQYAHTSWKVRDGFVKGAISCITQTPDGYLWLGTEFGLLRFDGVRPVAWQAPDGQALPSNRIFSLLAARNGTLWIGTSKGLASWSGGELTQYPALAGQAIRSTIVEDHEGAIWAGGLASSPSGRLCAIRNGDVRCTGIDGRLGNGVSGLYEDRHHNLWAGVRNGLWRWKPGSPEFFPEIAPAANGGGIQALAENDDGAILFGANNGTRRLASGKIETMPVPPALQQMIAVRMLRDHDGDLWIGTVDRGLVHVQRQGRTDAYTQADGLSGDFITALFIDREGSMWVATDGGLDRFRQFSVPTIGLGQGLSNASVLSVLADRDGSVWLSTRRGLNRWQNGQIIAFGRDGLLNGNYAGSLFQDSRGRIWASTLHDFGYLENDRFVVLKNVPGGAVYAICEDSAGSIWIANRERGLIQLSKNGSVDVTPWAALGHSDPALALAADSARSLRIGFQQGGIVYLVGGRITQSYSAAQGLGEGRVNNLWLDPDGTLWASTDGGLSRLRDGRIATLSSRNGLPCDGVHWTLEDDDHAFWLYTTCGLVRIDNVRQAGWPAQTHITLLDTSDGVRSLEDNGGYTPHAAKSSDGRIWFLPSDGASVLDPRHLPVNRLVPPVHIERITVDHKEYRVPAAGKSSLSLPERARDLEIEYTALSMVAAEKVRFRYMLEGWDQEWHDANGRRQAWYNNLPPRAYRFRVVACNNSGLWNEAGASLNFTIAPAYYQTTWFVLLCASAVLAILWAGYCLRLRQMARQFHMRMEGRLAERTRIARDLHDTMLQSFQAVLMKIQTIGPLLKDHHEARKSLDGVVTQARQAIVEGRNAVQDLRSSTQVTNDLARAVESLGQEFAADCPSGPGFHVRVDGESRDLAPLVRDDVHRIVCEAVRNAFRHAKATNIEVEIAYERRQLRVRVLDDGSGIDPKVLDDGGRTGHFGLPGMHERAKSLGGNLTVRSGTQAGTEIELIIPAPMAYAKAATKGTSQ